MPALDFDPASPDGMEHLLRAAQRELHKMGKVVSDGEFRKYAEQLQINMH